MEQYDFLKWETTEKERILHTPVYDVYSQKERAANGLEGTYVAIDAPDWVVVVAVHEGNFILVRQWRHGEDKVTLEFPGGVADPGEDLAATAIRELEEETGYRAGKITCLGHVSSNPALFKNHFSVYLAEELVQTGEQHLDEDELLRYEEHPIEEIIRRFGDQELTHAYMGTALMMYLRHRKMFEWR
ncbi:MAG: NUDIX hydrolase [Lachnospiraceae bacterium]|nr:NUDIX hydrolase [Lachnospiraceae bacterium]